MVVSALGGRLMRRRWAGLDAKTRLALERRFMVFWRKAAVLPRRNESSVARMLVVLGVIPFNALATLVPSQVVSPGSVTPSALSHHTCCRSSSRMAR